MTYWSDFVICTGIVILLLPCHFKTHYHHHFNFNINIRSLCDQQTSPFGPFDSFVTMTLLLLQLIWIDHSFLTLYVTLVIPSPCQIVGLALLWLIWSISLIVLVGHCDVCF